MSASSIKVIHAIAGALAALVVIAVVLHGINAPSARRARHRAGKETRLPPGAQPRKILKEETP